jgi:hypothetical protein
LAEKYIIAMPKAGATDAQGRTLGGDGLDDDRKYIQRDIDQRKGGPDPEYAFIEYTSIDDLVAQINALLTKNDVLKTLEVHAHGSPQTCGGIIADSLDSQGQALMTIRWDDNANFYLAGCNTGLTNSKAQVTESIAKRLSTAMKFDSKVTNLAGAPFHHHVTIWGTKGYMLTFGGVGGVHLELSSNTTKKVDKDDPSAPSYDGAEDASGKDCWIPNNNWT